MPVRLTDPAVTSRIAALRETGVPVRVSFGGASGRELAAVCGTAAELARAAHAQLAEVFGLSPAAAWQAMALTSMIGVNDVDGETFTLDDAARVREFARQRRPAWVSVWAAFRDRNCREGDSAARCSGVEQEDGAFGEAFAG
ncbi:hypothetical protein AB0K92_00520 [Streptomyces sp. NPDC052687]|uniref:hypothetical protein n=1 Tax=Streptomyces sp. NPDC052687 TaxID=3154759 RepID=UPI0034259421